MVAPKHARSSRIDSLDASRHPSQRSRPPAVEDVQAEYAGPLLIYALRRLGDRHAAEEVVQDTLMAAWQHGHRFDRNRGTFATWLFTIARNRTIDAARRRQRRPDLVPLDDEAPPVTELESDSEIERVVEAWQIHQALAALAGEHREVIVEVHYRGATVREAAARLGIAEGTVKSRLYRGLRALRLRLEEMGVIG